MFGCYDLCDKVDLGDGWWFETNDYHQILRLDGGQNVGKQLPVGMAIELWNNTSPNKFTAKLLTINFHGCAVYVCVNADTVHIT